MTRAIIACAALCYGMLICGPTVTAAETNDVTPPVKEVAKEKEKAPAKKTVAKQELKHVGNLLDTVIPHLVNSKGESVDYKDLKDKDYVVFYWSALWCGPCRKFSPLLVDFYRKNGGGKRFEVVFVSLDKSEDKMRHYMKRMPWYAIGWGQKGKTDIRKFAGGSIPHLMLIDKKGNILGRGRGQAYKVFAKLKEVLKDDAAAVEKVEK